MFKIILPLFIWMTCNFMANGQAITRPERTKEYLPLLKGKRVALMVNQTATIGHTHLVDSLLKPGIHI